MSALPPKADIAECDGDVRFVPKADIGLSGSHPIVLEWRNVISASRVVFDHRHAALASGVGG